MMPFAKLEKNPPGLQAAEWNHYCHLPDFIITISIPFSVTTQGKGQSRRPRMMADTKVIITLLLAMGYPTCSSPIIYFLSCLLLSPVGPKLECASDSPEDVYSSGPVTCCGVKKTNLFYDIDCW